MPFSFRLLGSLLPVVLASMAVFGPGVSCPRTATAADAEHDAVISQLLEEGWQIGPAGTDTIHQARPAVERMGDAEVTYALGLALLKHHQYDDAAAAFESAVKTDPQHYRSWRGLIWVRSLQEKFDVALVQIQRLAKELPPTELADSDEERVLETVRLLGRLFAFYEGPRSGNVSASLVAKVKGELEPALVGARQQEFENNYQDVTTLFTASTSEKSDAKDDALQQEQMQKLRQQQNLEVRRKQIDADQQQATEQIERLRSDWMAEQQKFDAMEAPLNASIAQLEAQQRVIRSELTVLLEDIFRLSEEVRHTKDPVRRDRLEREIFRLERLVNQYERDLAMVQAEGRRLTQSRNVIRARRLQTQQRYEGEIKQNMDRKQDLERAKKRLAVEDRRNSRPATGNTAKVRVLSAKATSVRTYADFPLEVERLTLLGR